MKKENKLTRDDAEDFLQSKGVFNHPYITFGDKENSMELADLMVEFANKYSQVKPFEFKEGDYVYQKEQGYVSIFKKQDNDRLSFHAIMISKFKINYNDSYSSIYTTSVEATPAQIKKLTTALAEDGKRWNAEKKQLEDLNEPKIGDDVIVWNEPRNQDASITKMTTHSPFIWDMVVRWDGTKEQFDRIREGGEE